jgi:hypothetical protein
MAASNEDEALPVEDADLPQNADAYMPSGLLPNFVKGLSVNQRKLFSVIRKAHSQYETALKKQIIETKRTREDSTKEALYNVFQQVKGTITAEKLTKLIDNAVERGDAQALRVLAMLAGEDLNERKLNEAGPGADVIIIRPHPKELTEAEEANVQKQIEYFVPKEAE